MNEKVTCLILSCDKFSDLWDGNVRLFNRNWPDRGFESFIVTESTTDHQYPEVGIIAAGEHAEWSERLSVALQHVKTEYVFITLDDYYLIQPVDADRMAQMIALMERDGYDYLRFFQEPKRATGAELTGYSKMYHVDTSFMYSVNLYPGIWKKEFLAFALREPKSAWDFEVSLAGIAREFGAKCICSYNDDYKILDVVRKGKILHAAQRYFKANPGLYEGQRPVQTWSYEVGLWIKTLFSSHSPMWLYPYLKKIYCAFGGKSYSG